MPGLTEANWEKRRGRVGASEVAALMPEGHPFRTKADVYASVVHGIDTFRGNATAVAMGHELEATVLRIASDRLGIRVRRNSVTRVHRDLPLAVTCDAYVAGTGNRIPVEVKTASAWQSDEWAEGNVPRHYFYQLQAQLMVTGGEYGYLVVLIGGRDFVGVRIEADPEVHAHMAEAITDFWADHNIPRIPPADTPSSLLWAFDIPEDVAAADGELETVGQMVSDLMSQQDIVKSSLDAAREGLIGLMHRRGLRLVTHSDWTAEVKPTKSGGSTLRFQRTRR